jgi:hypothetical protein
MTQYDAGPGDLSDRPWEDPEKKPQPHARRRRLTLPPWALLVILVAIVILLCVSLILIVRAISDGGDRKTPTPGPTLTTEQQPTNTPIPITPTPAVTPTSTIPLPAGTLEPTATPAGIVPGAMVVVQGTLGAGLNLRAEPSTGGRVIANAREGTVLMVLEGPQEANNYTWWKLRAPDGSEGWGAGEWLVLKTE